MKKKVFADHQQAARQLSEDVGSNNVKIYTVEDFRNRVQMPVYPDAFTDKCSEVYVITSGNAVSGRTWMAVIPLRVDVDRGAGGKVVDLDPTVFVLDSQTGNSHGSGVIGYHQGFEGRTTQVPGYEYSTLEDTVSDLRAKVVSGVEPMHNAPPEIGGALQHMVRKYGQTFGGEI